MSAQTDVVSRSPQRPAKAISSLENLATFLKSDTHHSIVSFLRNLCNAARGTRTGSSSSALSPPVSRLVSTLSRLQKNIKEHPPIKQSQRFGNKAFRSWYRSMEASALLSVRTIGELEKDVAEEIATYLVASFGNPTRLDFGTGHEAHFLLFLYCLDCAGSLESSDYRSLVTHVFPAYLEAARACQRVYKLEPAGSHGAWSLDDYHLLPFVLGAAQLDGNDMGIQPSSIRSESADKTFMFMNAVDEARRSKTGGSFRETCPMLFELGRIRCDWRGLCRRLVSMWDGEVLSRYPVAQHILFGSFVRATWTSTSPSTIRKGPFALRHAGVGPRKPVLEAYFGDVLARGGGVDRFFKRFPASRPTRNATTTARPPPTTTPHVLLPSGTGIRIGGWTITSTKSSLSGQTALSKMEKVDGLDFPLPEMVFGANSLSMKYDASSTTIVMEPVAALRGAKLTGNKRRKIVKVPAAIKWTNREDADGNAIRVVNDSNYDWTYTTFYEGTFSSEVSSCTDRKIDYDRLRRKDVPILWYDDVLLFESELDDNGSSSLRAKIRVMPSCFFVLLRFWVRVDRVLLRVFDTRVYHQFGSDHVVVERTEREKDWNTSMPSPSAFKDPNVFSSSLPVTFKCTRSLSVEK